MAVYDLAGYRKRLELVAAVAGYFASGGDPENVFATADAALLDYDNNFLPLIIAAAVAAYTAYEGGGNPVEGLRVLGRGESALQVLAAQGFEEALAFSSREFPELTAATLEAAEAAGELANLGFSYVDEATGNTISGTWNELPLETRDVIKGGAVFVSIVVPAGAGPKIAAKLRVRATNSGRSPWTQVSSDARAIARDIENATGVPIPSNQRSQLANQLRDVDHRNPVSDADYANLQREYRRNRTQMIQDWEANTGQSWPEGAQLHHVITQRYGGPNQWWNAHPALPSEHQGGIHGTGSPTQGVFPTPVPRQ